MRLPFKQARRARKPAGRAGRFPAHQKAKAQPERTADGGQVGAGRQMRAVGAIERIQIFVVSTDQVRRHRKPLEVRAVERRLLIGER